MRNKPILPKLLFDRRVMNNLNFAKQRDAVAARKIANAGFGILLKVSGLGGVGPGGHPYRPDSLRPDLGQYANPRVALFVDGRQCHYLAFRQQFFRLADHVFSQNKSPPDFYLLVLPQAPAAHEYRTYVCIYSIADESARVKQTKLKVFSGSGKSAKNRAKQPGTTTFAHNSTGLKTDPRAFRFCQIQRIFANFSSRYNSAPKVPKKMISHPRKNREGSALYPFS
jgi:hypothetical protein